MTFSPSLRAAAVGFASATVISAFGEIDYQVAPDATKLDLAVTITLPVTTPQTDLVMPNWLPGLYMLAPYWKNLEGFSATDASGVQLAVTKPNDDTWRVDTRQTKSLIVRYTIPPGRSTPFAPSIIPNETAIHYNGAATYLYVDGRKDEACDLDIEVPAGWRIALGLLPDGSGHRFKAPGYDVLADNPVTLGDFVDLHYKVAGKDHEIAIRGPTRNAMDLKRLLKITKLVSAMETDFFHIAPYDRYVWHFNAMPIVNNGYGMEHLSSTEIDLGYGLGPETPSLLSHEFFHLWNVKRIRSQALGPFDYTKLPDTGALWWLEGVTDYYAYHLLHRYGWSSDETFYADIATNVRGVRANPKRLEVSPHDSSFKMNTANGGVGNSGGFGVSYYDTGWVLGILLDLEIRKQTGGKKSLDDVELALWNECKDNQPGFPEDGIRTQLIAVGGPSLGDFYDKYVMRPGELPVEDELAKVGLQFVEKDLQTPSLFGWSISRSGAVVAWRLPSMAVLKVGDVVQEIDGQSLTSITPAEIVLTMNEASANARVGKKLRLKILRKVDQQPDQTLEVDIEPTINKRTLKVVEEVANPTPAQIKLRNAWFWGPKKRPSRIAGP